MSKVLVLSCTPRAIYEQSPVMYTQGNIWMTSNVVIVATFRSHTMLHATLFEFSNAICRAAHLQPEPS